MTSSRRPRPSFLPRTWRNAWPPSRPQVRRAFSEIQYPLLIDEACTFSAYFGREMFFSKRWQSRFLWSLSAGVSIARSFRLRDIQKQWQPGPGPEKKMYPVPFNLLFENWSMVDFSNGKWSSYHVQGAFTHAKPTWGGILPKITDLLSGNVSTSE